MKNLKKSYLLTGLLVIVVALIYCGKSYWRESQFSSTTTNQLGLPKMQYPLDNPPTKEKIALGRKLFMDRRLSHNNTMSCAMCHVPEQGFTVNEIATAVGIEGRSSRRNAPTLLNVGYLNVLFHDGREFSLENQVLGPMLAFNEMGNPSIGQVIEKIRILDDYKGLFKAAFGADVSLDGITKAIATYERSLVAGNSTFDQWKYSKDKKALNPIEMKGFNIFMNKGSCVSCHRINEKEAIFTDQLFHNTGIGWLRNNKIVNKIVEKNTFTVRLAPGVEVEVAQDQLDSATEKPQNDVGRFEITEDPKDRWAYKTPTLRNIALTAPYMHDGSLATLEDVVDFYNKGGEDNPLKDTMLKPLGLSETEKYALVAFLKALTSYNIKQLEIEARAAAS
ncbi:MAG: cytochrome c peroxidase [Methylophilaceae bacterium]